MSNVTGIHVRSLQSLKSFCPNCFKTVTVSSVSKQPGWGGGGQGSPRTPPGWPPTCCKNHWLAMPKPAFLPCPPSLAEAKEPLSSPRRRGPTPSHGLRPGVRHPHPRFSAHHPGPSSGTAAAGLVGAITDLFHFNTDVSFKKR